MAHAHCRSRRAPLLWRLGAALGVALGAGAVTLPPGPQGAAPAHAAPSASGARAPRVRLAPAVAGHGSQVAPSLCRLPSGVRLLAFERVFSASESRVYVKRRRPGFGWSYGRPVALQRGDHAQRAPSLLCQPDGTVRLYVQVGDRRRDRGRIRVYRSRGDSLRFTPVALWSLPLPGDSPGHVAAPFAAPWPAPGQSPPTLLTVTRLGGPRDLRGGCYVGRSPDGIRAPSLTRSGPGKRCRTIALSSHLLVQTYEVRSRLTRPLRAYLRVSRNRGRSWSAPRRLSPVQASFDATPIVLRAPARAGAPRGSLAAGGAVLLVARLGQRTAVLLRPMDRQGRLGGVRALTRWSHTRWRHPAGLPAGRGLQVFAAREVRPFDFDVLSLGVHRILRP